MCAWRKNNPFAKLMVIAQAQQWYFTTIQAMRIIPIPHKGFATIAMNYFLPKCLNN